MTLQTKSLAAALLTLSLAAMSDAAPATSLFPDAHSSQTSQCGDAIDKMSVADLDGDGKADLIVSSNKGIYVLLGNGDGTLRPCLTIIPEALNDFLAVDLDHDGAIDIIGWSEQGALLFYRGLGTSVTPAVTLVKYDRRTPFTVSDLNGDKLLDVVVAAPLGADNLPHVAILLGQSGGGFSAPATVQLANGVASDSISQLTEWDLDRDGHPDILVFAKSGLQVLRGDGRGGLQPTSTTFSVGPGIVADFDNDGYPDVVSSLPYGDLNVAFGSSAGWKRIQSMRLFPYDSILANDVDGDGFADLVTFRRGIFAVLHNRRDGSFDSPAAWFSNIAAYLFTSGDLRGDGHRDLIFFGEFSKQLGFQIVPGLPGGRYDATPALLAPDPEEHYPLPPRVIHDVFASDIDHDGYPDLIVITTTSPSGGLYEPEIVVFHNDREGRFARWQTVRLPQDFFAWAVGSDLDGDGNLDIVLVPTFNSSSTPIFFGNSDGTFTKQVVNLPGQPSSQTFDYFHDGRPELVFPGDQTSHLASVTRNGTVDSFGWPGDGRGTCDVNGDGLLDTVSSIIVKNLGRTSCTVVPSPIDTSYTFPLMADMDGDRHADAVTFAAIAPAGDDALQTWFGFGDFTFAAPVYCGTNAVPERLVDVDGDGKTDAVVYNGVLISRGDGSYAANGTLQDGHLAAFADLDGDGILDAVAMTGEAIIPLISHPVQTGSLPVSLKITLPQSHAFYGAGIRVTPQLMSSFGVPTGSITFREGSRVSATMLAGTSVTLPLGAGAHSITADYSGDARFASSSAVFACQVDKNSAQIVFSAAGNVSSLPVVLTASFGKFAGQGLADFIAPTGTFTFYAGQQVIGVRSASSKASVNVTPAQNSQLRIDYSGDDNRPAGNVFIGSFTLLTVPVSPADSKFTVTPVDRGYDLDVELRGSGGTALNLDPTKLPAINFITTRGSFDGRQPQYRGNGHIGIVLYVNRTPTEDLIISAAVGATLIATTFIGPQPRLRAARR